MDLQLTWDIFVILFFVALISGFVDTIAGGGGLITVPSLLLTGIPPINALATNKLQGFFGTFVASLNMLRHGVVSFKALRLTVLMSFIGASIGTILVQFLDMSVLNVAIPIVLTLVGLYFLFTPSAGKVEGRAKVSDRLYQGVIVPCIGFYDGVLGPGTGSFFSLAGVALKGQSIIKATASAKLFNCASNVASALIFILGGKTLWALGLTMMCGQVIGATLGSKVVVSHGGKVIRPLIVLMCFLMLIRYLYDRF